MQIQCHTITYFLQTSMFTHYLSLGLVCCLKQIAIEKLSLRTSLIHFVFPKVRWYSTCCILKVPNTFICYRITGPICFLVINITSIKKHLKNLLTKKSVNNGFATEFANDKIIVFQFIKLFVTYMYCLCST